MVWDAEKTHDATGKDVHLNVYDCIWKNEFKDEASLRVFYHVLYYTCDLKQHSFFILANVHVNFWVICEFLGDPNVLSRGWNF